jgi:hypothetical protein
VGRKQRGMRSEQGGSLGVEAGAGIGVWLALAISHCGRKPARQTHASSPLPSRPSPPVVALKVEHVTIAKSTAHLNRYSGKQQATRPTCSGPQS